MEEMKNCPKCKSEDIETHQDSVDIGVGVQHGPLYWRCHDCKANSDTFCEPDGIHEWTSQQQGGDPANADSTEWVAFCKKCGTIMGADMGMADEIHFDESVPRLPRSERMCECGHFKEEHTLPPFLGCGSCRKCDCFIGLEAGKFCDSHLKYFERIEDRQEHFAEENADPFGCPDCYLICQMEV